MTQKQKHGSTEMIAHGEMIGAAALKSSGIDSR